MANELIKKIAIFKKEGSGSGSWESKEIGAKAANISLSSPIAGVNSNVEQVLQTILPENTLASGFIESNNGQLTKSSKSDAITNFFETGDTTPYQGNLSQLKEDLENKVSRDSFTTLIDNYLNSLDGEIKPGLSPVQIVNLIYPIGSVLTLFNENTPQQLGLGSKWKQIDDQKFLLPSTSRIKTIGGSAQVTPTITLNLSDLIQIAPHDYTPNGKITSNLEVAKNGLGLNAGNSYTNQVVGVNTSSETKANFEFEGRQVALGHNIQTQSTEINVSSIQLYPPYITVHMWERTELDQASNYYGIGTVEEGEESSIVDYIINKIMRDTDFDFNLITKETAKKWKEVLEIEEEEEEEEENI